MLLLCYPKCSTCQKAKKWLDANKIKYEERDLTVKTPKIKELKDWQKKSGLPLKKFFNTSGLKYRELGLKDKIADMKDAELYRLLASDGMLIKRPIIIHRNKVLVGFNEAEWKAALKPAAKKTAAAKKPAAKKSAAKKHAAKKATAKKPAAKKTTTKKAAAKKPAAKKTTAKKTTAKKTTKKK